MMRRLAFLAGITFATTAHAQLPDEPWFSSCDGPIATCMSPRVSHGLEQTLFADSPRPVRQSPSEPTRSGPDAAIVSRDDDFADCSEADHGEPGPIADLAHETLNRWEAASRNFLPVTEAERLRLRFSPPVRNGREVELICDLREPVRAEDLRRRYDWEASRDLNDTTITLTAVPKDDLERLFYERFTLTFDESGAVPSTLVLPQQEGGLYAGLTPFPVVLQPVPAFAFGDVQLVGFSSEWGMRPVRTADLSGDAPTLQVPPPAPPCEAASRREPVEVNRP